MSDTAARLLKVIHDQTGIEAERLVDHALLIDDLGLDWLDIVQLSMACEQEFGVEVPDDARIDCVRDLVDLIDRQLVAA